MTTITSQRSTCFQSLNETEKCKVAAKFAATHLESVIDNDFLVDIYNCAVGRANKEDFSLITSIKRRFQKSSMSEGWVYMILFELFPMYSGEQYLRIDRSSSGTRLSFSSTCEGGYIKEHIFGQPEMVYFFDMFNFAPAGRVERVADQRWELVKKLLS